MYIKKRDRVVLERICSSCEKIALPNNFDDWLNKYPFKDKFYMFFKIIGSGANKQYIGACQHCKNENIVLGKVKNASYGKCPICHKKVKYRNEKYCNYITDRDYVWCVSKIDENEFVLRHYLVCKISKYTSYSYFKSELERVVLNYSYLDKKFHCIYILNSYSGSWSFGSYKTMYYSIPDINYVYYSNLNMFCFNNYEYCNIKRYAKMKKFYPLSFLDGYLRYPQIEYLIKLKMFDLVDDIISTHSKISFLNVDKHKIKEFLMLNSYNYNFALKNNIGLDCLRGLVFLQSLNVDNPTMNKCKFASFLYSVVSFNDIRKELFDMIGFNSLYSYFNLSLKDLPVLYDYFDYLGWCLALGYNIEDTKYSKPQNFKLAHDNTYKKFETFKTKNLYNKVKKQLRKYKILNYFGKKYSVIVPVSAEDIILEGENMSNCVASYLGAVSNGSSVICFVRHTKDIKNSFYTLALDTKDLSIVQCRGYNNEPTTEETSVLKFVNKWHSEIVLKKLQCG